MLTLEKEVAFAKSYSGNFDYSTNISTVTSENAFQKNVNSDNSVNSNCQIVHPTSAWIERIHSSQKMSSDLIVSKKCVMCLQSMRIVSVFDTVHSTYLTCESIM